MSKKKVILIGGGVLVLVVMVLANIKSQQGHRTAVQVTPVALHDVSKVITASGEIQPKKRVNVSAGAIGKVTRLAVKEGDHVNKGDFLLEIDATNYEASVSELEAAVRGAEASVDLENAALQKAKDDYERAQQLSEKGFLSDTELKSAKASIDMAQARAKSASETLQQTRSSLKKAQHELTQMRITAEMAGVITGLNVEEGESAIMGTLNNPGTVLLTISDLSEIEAEVRVDETEVVMVKPGQPAVVRLDARPDTTFQGVVTEVGNSAIRSQAGLGQESVDFKVKVAIKDVIPNVRPGLSASVDITVAQEKSALAVPIQSLTVRDEARLKRERAHGNKLPKKGDAVADTNSAAADTSGSEAKPKDIEGVFVVDKDVAHFRPVRVGIAGQSNFIVKSGLSKGEQVVSGPFKVIAELKDGERVKIKREKEKEK
ncbi:MAG TPA: efflux RND transporter periplasmic adaptor subunit [Candidatus Krumholzibacteria bacterium]|nr:efflux RND transporter periplasmic adaptor subunit [Candidatus Krumholzibacteria bacterium]